MQTTKKVFSVDIWEWEWPLLYVTQTIVYSLLNNISLVEADHIRTLLRESFKTLFHLQLFVWIPAPWEPREKRESSTFFLHNFRLVPDNSCVINGLTLVRRHTVRGGGGKARFCPTQWIIISTSGHIFSAVPELLFPREQQWCFLHTELLQISSIWPEMSMNNAALFLWLSL